MTRGGSDKRFRGGSVTWVEAQALTEKTGLPRMRIASRRGARMRDHDSIT